MRKTNFIVVLLASVSICVTSCASRSGSGNGTSNPIDSTNVKGTAPATYGGNNPIHDQDSNKSNFQDTGTKANNVIRSANDSERMNQTRK